MNKYDIEDLIDRYVMNHMDADEYEKALESYGTAMEIEGTEDLQDKVNDKYHAK